MKGGFWWKESKKDAYFGLLGYNTLFTSRNVPVDNTVETKRIKKMKEMHTNLVKVDGQGIKDTPWRRKASISDVFSNNIGAFSQRKNENLFEHNLLTFAEGLIAFETSWLASFMEGGRFVLVSW